MFKVACGTFARRVHVREQAKSLLRGMLVGGF